MRFIPHLLLNGILVSIWETRVRDFQEFITATGGDTDAEWNNPGFAQVPNDPVIRVSWDSAIKFCAWLTERERRAGLLTSEQFYRLPTDYEWSRFGGLPESPDTTPEAKNNKIVGVYPWRSGTWPPGADDGNYGGDDSPIDQKLHGLVDGYPYTAPAGSFNPNLYGLYDLGGNAGEWVMDWFNMDRQMNVIRGGNYLNDAPTEIQSSHRAIWPKGDPNGLPLAAGFRCVLVLIPADQIKSPTVDPYPPPADSK
jgi:formylglycine-generating enzyme required for sulfatase activity